MATPIPSNEAAFTLDELLAATGGTAIKAGPAVSGVAIDSREVSAGGLFVAIQGAALDGHRYVAGAVATGAVAVLVHDDVDVPDGVGVIRVADTTRALGDLSRFHRRRWGRRVVGITGSSGKTSTKELCAAALAAGGLHVLATRGNLNNLWGVPMTLLQLTGEHDLAVIEMGTNQPGEIARLAEVSEPDIGLLTMVSEAHTEGLGGLAAVLQEKTGLFRALPDHGCAVTLGDDPGCAEAAKLGPAARHLLFGRQPGCDVRVLGEQLLDDLRSRARLAIERHEGEVAIDLMMPGSAAALNAAAALAVALAAGVDLDLAAEALSSVPPAPGRMQVTKVAGRTVLDDTYNANPSSTSGAIKTLAEVARLKAARAVAFLGDMRELGGIALRAHRRVVDEAVRERVDMLVGCGDEMSVAIESTTLSADAGVVLRAVGDSGDAAAHVGEWTQPGDVVLVKGSRSMRMEVIIEAMGGIERVEA